MIDDVVRMYHEGNADFHQMVADMAGVSRKEAKTVNLGIMYGMGKKKLAGTLDITEEEAKGTVAQVSRQGALRERHGRSGDESSDGQGCDPHRLGRKCRFDMWEPKVFGYHRALPLEEAVKEYGGRGA